MNIAQVTNIAVATAQRIVHEVAGLNRTLLDTTDDTLTEAVSLTPDDQTAGLLRIKGVGFDATDMVAGERLYAWKKVSDVVTVTEIGTAAMHNDAALSTSGISAVADSADISIRVLGYDGIDISWHIEYELLTVAKESTL